MMAKSDHDTDADRLYRLGRKHLAMQQIAEARRCFEVAVKSRHPGAMAALGEMLLNWPGRQVHSTETAMDRGLMLLAVAANAGSTDAARTIMRYAKAIGGPYKQAVAALEVGVPGPKNETTLLRLVYRLHPAVWRIYRPQVELVPKFDDSLTPIYLLAPPTAGVSSIALVENTDEKNANVISPSPESVNVLDHQISKGDFLSDASLPLISDHDDKIDDSKSGGYIEGSGVNYGEYAYRRRKNKISLSSFNPEVMAMMLFLLLFIFTMYYIFVRPFVR